MGKYWAGLDVGLETTRVCVIDDAGEVLHEATCATDVQSLHRDLRFLRRRRFVRVGLETGLGIPLARGLRSLGYCVDLYEARQLSKFLRVRRNKTDEGDAQGIAEAGRIGASVVSKVFVKSMECQLLQSRLSVRKHLISSRVRSTNLLRNQLEQYGGRVRCDARSPRLRETVELEIKKLFGRISTPLVTELQSLLDHCERLLAQQQALDKDLKQRANEIEICRRMMGIPGVGPICALTFYATVSEPHRFSRTAKIGSYLGMVPTLRQSGQSSRSGRISKMGNKSARALLVCASTQFMKWGDPRSELHVWATGIEQRRGRGRARVALARKLAVIMLAMWKSGATYRANLIEVPQDAAG